MTCKCGNYYACQPTEYDDCGSSSIGVTDSASCSSWCGGGESTFVAFGTVDLSEGGACGCEDANGGIIKACVGASTKTSGKDETGGGGDETPHSEDTDGEEPPSEDTSTGVNAGVFLASAAATVGAIAVL